ncbi:NAD(P)/FAD-dependent oxidoreductase [Burkholderia gladioli]|uniref:NAD(P)/FAD-dependent oxidoreductase n=1 Tax=Burkholderia gladioli TaxID=28095 RepID=UPI0016404350|nr:FAD-dependent oxidoreductase [Burkholderia gladioli]
MSADPVVIVGAGHAARRAAEALRERDAALPIVMLGEEPEAPYDRPLLSKDVLLAAAEEPRLFVREPGWYAQQRIELRLAARVEAIDRAAQRVRLADGASLPYARLLLATGSRVRPFGGELEPGVPLHYVRTLADTRALREALRPGLRVAVLGGGFIGLEVAASAVRLGCRVSVIDPAARLLGRAMPPEVGEHALALHRRHGVEARLGVLPERVRRDPRDSGGALLVETSEGEVPADVVVVGIGVVPNVELAQAAGLEVADGIRVDAGCRTLDPAIFAAGEVTSHFHPLAGRHVRTESWQIAERQPAVAAANLLGGEDAYAELPWLWSDQYDSNLQTLGWFEPGQRRVLRGEPGRGPFAVFGLDGEGRLAAAAVIDAGREMAVCRRLAAARVPLDAARLADPAVALRSLL